MFYAKMWESSLQIFTDDQVLWSIKTLNDIGQSCKQQPGRQVLIIFTLLYVLWGGNAVLMRRQFCVEAYAEDA